MTYTPVELRHVRVGRSLFGYNRAMVEQMIEEVAESFETTWRERGELADQVEALEKQVAELRQREDLLAHTLVAAEQTASEVRDQARRAAEMVLNEAQQEARGIVRAAESQRESLVVESRRIESMLRAALLMLDQGDGAQGRAAEAARAAQATGALPGVATPAALEPAAAPSESPAPAAAAPSPQPEQSAWPQQQGAERGAVALPPFDPSGPSGFGRAALEPGTVADAAPEQGAPGPAMPAAAGEPATSPGEGSTGEQTAAAEAPLPQAPSPQAADDETAHGEPGALFDPTPGAGPREFDWGE